MYTANYKIRNLLVYKPESIISSLAVSLLLTAESKYL